MVFMIKNPCLNQLIKDENKEEAYKEISKIYKLDSSDK